ncbi:MAG TPA: hypothetical protein VLF39_03180 [Candidatus Saccharimonadales bacterium]|nr:hypothetical protein [Candidatus Saccharimonadales bacterium]
MTRSRRPHSIWAKLKQISIGYLVLGFIVCFAVTVMALRHNNLTAIYLRNQVIQVDKQNGDVAAALNNLRVYIYSHMNAQLSVGSNTDQPPIQLKYSYERLVAQEKNRVSTVNSAVYSQAQTQCEKLFPHNISGGGRVPCVQAYIAKHGTKERPIPDGLYKFNFISPIWTADLAGWSLAATLILGLVLTIRLIIYHK